METHVKEALWPWSSHLVYDRVQTLFYPIEQRLIYVTEE